MSSIEPRGTSIGIFRTVAVFSAPTTLSYRVQVPDTLVPETLRVKSQSREYGFVGILRKSKRSPCFHGCGRTAYARSLTDASV
jgi:hypothetical protein